MYWAIITICTKYYCFYLMETLYSALSLNCLSAWLQSVILTIFTRGPSNMPTGGNKVFKVTCIEMFLHSHPRILILTHLHPRLFNKWTLEHYPTFETARFLILWSLLKVMFISKLINYQELKNFLAICCFELYTVIIYTLL